MTAPANILSLQGRQKLKEKLRFHNYATNYLRIKDKKAQLIPFQFNKAQLVIEEVRQWILDQGLPERYIILKARQKGISTYFEADIFHKASTKKNQKCAIIGHKLEASQNLYDMTLRYYQYLDPRFKPITQNTNEKKLKYRKLESEIKVMTAGISGDDVGRSDTVNRLHATEIAFWNQAKQTLLSLLQTVPDQPNTLVVLESTANGIGGEFYDRWQEIYANDQRVTIIPNVAWYSPDSGYVAIFISWLIDDEYTLSYADEKERKHFENTLSDDERSLIRNGATLEHLKWRRQAIRNKAGGDVNLFTQEYPSTPESAFLTTGRPVFNQQICFTNYTNSKPVFKQGDLIPVYDTINRDYQKLVAANQTDYELLMPYIKSMEFVENSKGFIKLHYDFKLDDNDKYRFAGGSDVAEGLEQGDYTVLKVLDRKFNKVMLTWHGHLDVDLYAEELHKIQTYFKKDIYIAIERNNHGLAVINRANRLGVNLYYAEEFNKGYSENTQLIGFKTTVGTRTQMINDLIEAIRDEEFQDSEREAWSEALTFVKNEQGKMQAQGKDKDPSTKCYDDRIFAWIGMWKCHLWMPNYKRLIAPDTTLNWVKKIKKKRFKSTSAMSR